jgi:Flp pilus assembly pilin Flp
MLGRERRKEEKMKNVIRYLRDQQGVETLEWILIGGLITGVGIVLYPGVLEGGLTNVLNGIVATITAQMP